MMWGGWGCEGGARASFGPVSPQTQPRWLFVGDSLTSTNPLVPDWVTTIGPRIPASITTINVAVGGNETVQILAQWRAQNDFIPSRVFVLGGVNDIRGGIAASVAYANLSAIYSEAAAQLCSVVAIVTMPFKNSPSWLAAEQTQLMLLRSSIMSTPGVTVVDLYSLMGQPGDVEALAAIYDSGDGLHPNGAGTTVMANAIATAIGLP